LNHQLYVTFKEHITIYNKNRVPKFHECYNSDHRGIYCDLSCKLFDNAKINDKGTRKRLVGTNSTNYEGTQYIQQIYGHLINNNIIKKTQDLLKQVKSGTFDQQVAINQLDMLDKLITDIMLKSGLEEQYGIYITKN
jgi:hypothetical protein